jgi:predicted TIM-barrel fold metal-dependent hydrolase
MEQPHAPACAAPDPNPHRPAVAVPALACDCHAHVFEGARFGYQATRAYTPPDAPVGQLLSLHDTLGIARGVVVQASVHGIDNAAVLAAVAAHPDRLRAVAAVTEEVTDRELARLHAGGVRGIRVNLVDRGGMPFRSLDALADMAARIRDMGWHIELLVHVESSPDLRRIFTGLNIPVSVGHVGYTRTSEGLEHPGYRDFLAMLRDGFGWVKLTGPYRVSAQERVPYNDVAPFVKAVVAAAPDRIVWGSDWPHVMVTRPMPNDGDLLDVLGQWVPDATLRRRILVDNPQRLYWS